MNDGRRYTVKEICQATGLKNSAVYYRLKKAGIPTCGLGYTLDQVKIIVKTRPTRRAYSQKNAETLHARLMNDGAL